MPASAFKRMDEPQQGFDNVCAITTAMGCVSPVRLSKHNGDDVDQQRVGPDEAAYDSGTRRCCLHGNGTRQRTDQCLRYPA
ncbi:hypothetical protein BDZ89DRAFT_1064807, partial [Hymenopellis radicata]